MIPSADRTRPDEDGPAAAIADLLARFEQAADAAGGVLERAFRVGGCVIRIRCAGPALVPVLVPFAHLTSDAAAPDLTVHLWDAASTGTPPPPFPDTGSRPIASGELWLHRDEPLLMALRPADRLLSVVHADRRVAACWMPDATRLPYDERVAPLRHVLALWHRRHGRFLVHAAAVGDVGGAALLAGANGTGKSTTALTCLGDGLSFLGDNYILLSRETAPVAYSLFSSAALEPEQARRHPGLLPGIAGASRVEAVKTCVLLAETHADRLPPRLPLRAILLPSFAGAPDTTVEPVGPAAALRAFASSIYSRVTGSDRAAFRFLAGIVRDVPAYALRLGTDLGSIPPAIRDVLTRPPGARPRAR